MTMKRLFGSFAIRERSGKVGYALLWLLGIPLPILLLIYILRGCQ
jgi:hypothetical protein